MTNVDNDNDCELTENDESDQSWAKWSEVKLGEWR